MKPKKKAKKFCAQLKMEPSVKIDIYVSGTKVATSKSVTFTEFENNEN